MSSKKSVKKSAAKATAKRAAGSTEDQYNLHYFTGGVEHSADECTDESEVRIAHRTHIEGDEWGTSDVAVIPFTQENLVLIQSDPQTAFEAAISE